MRYFKDAVYLSVGSPKDWQFSDQMKENVNRVKSMVLQHGIPVFDMQFFWT